MAGRKLPYVFSKVAFSTNTRPLTLEFVFSDNMAGQKLSFLLLLCFCTVFIMQVSFAP